MKRKSVLIAIAAISLMALVGLGTNAEFSDTEVSGDQTFTAGTLDLVVGGAAQTTPINATGLVPGDTAQTGVLTVTNSGSVAGDFLLMKVNQVANSDLENGCEEPEDGQAGDTDKAFDPGTDTTCADPGPGEGELEDALTVAIWDGDTATGTKLIEDTLANLAAGSGHTFATGLAGGGGSKTLTIQYSLPSTATNLVQGDSVQFNLSFDLEQDGPADSGTAI